MIFVKSKLFMEIIVCKKVGYNMLLFSESAPNPLKLCLEYRLKRVTFGANSFQHLHSLNACSLVAKYKLLTDL